MFTGITRATYNKRMHINTLAAAECKSNRRSLMRWLGVNRVLISLPFTPDKLQHVTGCM
jgi:hypothetical protein